MFAVKNEYIKSQPHYDINLGDVGGGGGGLAGLLSVHIDHLFIWTHVPLVARPLESLEVAISRWG